MGIDDEHAVVFIKSLLLTLNRSTLSTIPLNPPRQQ